MLQHLTQSAYPETDFIKLDIQIGELNALHGSIVSLKKCLRLEIGHLYH